MAPSSSASPFHGGLKILVYTSAFLGAYSIWGQSISDGSNAILVAALHGKNAYILPRTNEQLLSKITGVYPVDYLLRLLIVYWWEVVDGSHPRSSAIGLYFAGQILGIVTTLYVDSYRSGNAGNWKFNATFWLLVFQFTTIATSGPWFLAVYLSASPLFTTPVSSPRFTSLHEASPFAIWLLPASILVGYILPTIFMVLPSPSLVSHTFHQHAIAAWNIFPLFVFLMQTILSSFLGLLVPLTPAPSSSSTKEKHLNAVRLIYGLAFTLSFIMHIVVVTLSVASVLFPMVFAPGYAAAFRPAALFIPPISWTTVSTMGQGVAGGMLWDSFFGYFSMLLLAVVGLRRVQSATGSSVQWTYLAGGIIAGTLIFGPGATIVALNWGRDELLSADNHRQEATRNTFGILKQKN